MYYNRLLMGAVAALLDLEEQSKTAFARHRHCFQAQPRGQDTKLAGQSIRDSLWIRNLLDIGRQHQQPALGSIRFEIDSGH